MKTNKKAIGCLLAVVMLLVVSVVSAGTYVVRPALNNADIEEQRCNVDVEEQEQVVAEEEQIPTGQIPTLTPAHLFLLGEATLNVHASIWDYSHGLPVDRYPLRGGLIHAVPLIFPL